MPSVDEALLEEEDELGLLDELELEDDELLEDELLEEPYFEEGESL